MPFQITLWTPVVNQKINQTQKSIYTLQFTHPVEEPWARCTTVKSSYVKLSNTFVVPS